MLLKEKCCAIIVAGGKGKRMGVNTVKQFLQLKDKPILAHTINEFENNKNIDEIIIVIGKEEKEYCESNIIKKYLYKKVVAVVEGGQERQDSVYNALKVISPGTGIVLVHDGVRPFIQQSEINEIIKTTIEKKACVLAAPVKHTIKHVNKETLTVKETLNRNNLWEIQTPQGFNYNTFLKAHENAKAKNYLGTDDATLIEVLGEEVHIVKGGYKNIKITTKEDLEYASFLMGQNN